VQRTEPVRKKPTPAAGAGFFSQDKVIATVTNKPPATADQASRTGLEAKKPLIGTGESHEG